MSRLKPESEFKLNCKPRPEQLAPDQLKNALHITQNRITLSG